MKLIFVNRYFHPDHSATSQLLSDLVFHLAGLGGREIVVIASRQRYDDAGGPLTPQESVHGVEVRRVWTSRFGRKWLPGRTLDYLSFYLTSAMALWRTARRGDVIVALTDPPLISIVAGMLAQARGSTLVNWVQDAFPEVAEKLGVHVPFRVTLRDLRNRSMCSAAINVVLGERMAEWARGEGIPGERIAVIYNWADGEAIVPLTRAENSLRADWGLADKFVVAYSGNLGRAHEFRTLLDAAERLRNSPDIIFLFIGGGHHYGALEVEAATRGLSSMQFMPYQPQERLRQSLGAADVHWISLLPDLEGLIVPSKVYGILAAGRPTLMVGDSDGEIGRLLRHHECGLTVATGDGAELASAILHLRDWPDVREAMSHRARVAFNLQYSRNHGLTAWERVFLSLQTQG